MTSSDNKLIIAVTMATGLQGSSVVNELSKSNKFLIRAITRNPSSQKAIALSKLPNVEIYKGDLLERESLIKCFKGAYGIFGNTTPTKGVRPLVRKYEIAQGKNLINCVNEINQEGSLKHFVFSSICKAKNPLLNEPAPGHFSSKWDIENYLLMKGVGQKTTILRPASYFENFDSDLPGLKITKTTFPGVVNPNNIWQTIAVSDIGKWTSAVFLNPNKFIGQSINLAGEEKTGNQMAEVLEKVNPEQKVNYFMIPRIFMKLFVHDIGVMADWIERAQYGANIQELKKIAKEEGITMTSLESWLKEKRNKTITE